MGWFGSEEGKKVQHSGDNNETKKQIRKLPGVSKSGSGIHEEEINSFVSSLNEGDVIHFVMGITSLHIDQIIDYDLLDVDDDDDFVKNVEKATINKGERYDGSGLVGALGDKLLIVMNGGKDKFDFAYNELNGISDYSKIGGQYIRIDRKNKVKGKALTGNIYFEKQGGSWNPLTKSGEGWKGFNEWFPSHLEDSRQRIENSRKREERERGEEKERQQEEREERKREEEKERQQKEREEKEREEKKKKNVNGSDTIYLKDSVVNKSNVDSGGSSKMQELKDLAEMKKEGLIDDDEFKQMKKEILGK